MNIHTRIVHTREEAHEAVTRGYAYAQSLLADGKRVKISIGEDDEPISIKQRGFLHAAVLPQIAEQVRVDGERYVVDIWKEYFRKEFLGYRWEMRRPFKFDPKLCRLVQAKRATPFRIRNSTEDLNVRKYSEYIERVIAHAVTEWGVVFHFRAGEREAAQWVRPIAKCKVDQDTGEILA